MSKITKLNHFRRSDVRCWQMPCAVAIDRPLKGKSKSFYNTEICRSIHGVKCDILFLYTVADVVQVYTKSGWKAAQCTEQLGHIQLFHPRLHTVLETDWNSTETRGDVAGCIHSPLFSGINAAAELTEGSAVVNVFHISLLLTRAAVT